MKEINIALIGAGRMGISQSKAFSNVAKVYNDGLVPVLWTVADACEAPAGELRQRFGYRNATTDWRRALDDGAVDLVVVTTPNDSHVEIALAALAAGKHVLCEKPLGLDAAQARPLVDAAKGAGLVNAVGFNYMHNPMIQYAGKLVRSGELGAVVAFRGVYDMDYNADPDLPHNWRQLSPVAGALGDLGSHMLGISAFLVGDIGEVCGVADTVYAKRPDPDQPGRLLDVENDDQFHMVYKYENGATGTLHTSRVAPGRKIGLRFELQCERGTILFDEERLNELQVYRHGDPREEQGFKLVRCNVDHGDYRFFTGTAGVGITYIDLVTIQAHGVLQGVAGGVPFYPDFEAGWKVCRVMDAALKSAAERRWVKLAEI